mmetsp:Transcript_7716/g.10576  ORF Transcript_7716/g.10576 Transcript_7716/m.10576 type:complete len:285 (-) Transcript_7716:814-1668(-)|eukprot:CAMPEP_0185271302 /NCGR_PEP_ID=MMETSP1359-20130426/44429_1 /TAXON_ID=552665 /ORGANISM="Bigelowiella longifila, Strain CCMP242" /LENGTH=284 /DNA_ID=CAMNT_0027863197 /DNA_START=56 /DNA_END=910 /DNA_ORIENTATION=-
MDPHGMDRLVKSSSMNSPLAAAGRTNSGPIILAKPLPEARYVRQNNVTLTDCGLPPVPKPAHSATPIVTRTRFHEFTVPATMAMLLVLMAGGILMLYFCVRVFCRNRRYSRGKWMTFSYTDGSFLSGGADVDGGAVQLSPSYISGQPLDIESLRFQLHREQTNCGARMFARSRGGYNADYDGNTTGTAAYPFGNSNHHHTASVPVIISAKSAASRVDDSSIDKRRSSMPELLHKNSGCSNNKSSTVAESDTVTPLKTVHSSCDILQSSIYELRPLQRPSRPWSS